MVVKIGTFGNDLLLGTDGADTLQGSFGDDTLRGFKGNDVLSGGADDDTLEGGKGNDSLYGDAGDDHLDGGAGNDTAVFNTAGDVEVSLTAGVATSNLGNDTLASVENIVTGDGDDDVTGNDFANILSTGAGSDIVSANGGNDIVNLGSGNDIGAGDAGNDLLNGGSGDDDLYGGYGVDILTGGSGADLFGFYADDEYGTDSGVGPGNRDRITDFNPLEDVIDVGDVGDLSFVGQSAFSGVNQVRYFHSGGDTIVQVNHDGVSGADLEIQLDGIFNLQGNDFVL